MHARSSAALPHLSRVRRVGPFICFDCIYGFSMSEREQSPSATRALGSYLRPLSKLNGTLVPFFPPKVVPPNSI